MKKWIGKLFSAKHTPHKPTRKSVSQPSHMPLKSTYNQKGHQFEASHNVAQLAAQQGLGYGNMSGDAAVRYDRQTLIDLTRQVQDENIVFSSIMDRMVSNLMGPHGFTLQARTGNKEFDVQIEKLWKRWGKYPEYRDLFSWKRLQDGVARELLAIGDVGFVKVNNGQLQAVEAEYINTPTNEQIQTLGNGRIVEGGVEMTRGGKVTGYWVTEPSPDGFMANHGQRIPRESFIYCPGQFQRFSRTRPLPPFIQAMSCIWRLDDILDSEAIAWQLLAKNAFAVTKADADEDAYNLSESDSHSETMDAPVQDRFTDHASGLIFWGEPGESVTGIDRNLPGKDFPASVRAFFQLFATRFGLPLEILMLDWSKTNFSSGRAALNQATVSIRKWQTLIVEQFHAEVYAWKIRGWIKSGELVVPAGMDEEDIFAHEWFPPAIPWIDPKEEAEAWGIRVDRGLVTFSDALKEQNKDRSEENERRREDILEAITIAKTLQEETGVDVPWQYFAGYAIGKTESAVKEANSDETPEEKPEEPEEDNETADEDDTND